MGKIMLACFFESHCTLKVFLQRSAELL